MVRDEPSAAFAHKHFDCPVVLAPDCAFGLGPLAPSGDPSCALFGLLRTDKERAPADRSPLAALRPRVGDWVGETGPHHARLAHGSPWSSFPARWLPGVGSAAAFDRAAQRRLHRGIRMLSSGSQVITDRLHGHILSLLLGIPHVALDNSYGKIAAYFRSWTHATGPGCSSPTPARRPRPCAGSPPRLGRRRRRAPPGAWPARRRLDTYIPAGQ
jgi:pyruvyl transferase EpsO